MHMRLTNLIELASQDSNLTLLLKATHTENLTKQFGKENILNFKLIDSICTLKKIDTTLKVKSYFMKGVLKVFLCQFRSLEEEINEIKLNLEIKKKIKTHEMKRFVLKELNVNNQEIINFNKPKITFNYEVQEETGSEMEPVEILMIPQKNYKEVFEVNEVKPENKRAKLDKIIDLKFKNNSKFTKQLKSKNLLVQLEIYIKKNISKKVIVYENSIDELLEEPFKNNINLTKNCFSKQNFIFNEEVRELSKEKIANMFYKLLILLNNKKYSAAQSDCFTSIYVNFIG